MPAAGERMNEPFDDALAEVLHGPAVSADGTTNLVGALARSMAFAGHATCKDFQKADLLVEAGLDR